MIIDKDGNILQAWYSRNGNLIHHHSSKYNVKFAIAVPYDSNQKAKATEIEDLKKYLKSTDYKAIKFAEGLISPEEFEEEKEQRMAARARINELEFEPPTLTQEEIERAEDIAMRTYREQAIAYLNGGNNG